MFLFAPDNLASPGLLPFALPLCLWVLVSAALARRQLRSWSFYLATLIRALVVVALLYFLAGPVAETTSQLPRRIEVHADVSQSLKSRDRESWWRDLQQELQRLPPAASNILLEVYAFGGRAELLWSGPLADFAAAAPDLLTVAVDDRFEPLASDLQASLDLALAHRQQGEGLGRLIFSDGVLAPPRRADPVPHSRIMTPVASAEMDFSILNLSVTKRTEQGLPLGATLTWSATYSGTATLVFAGAGKPLKSQELTFQPGLGETSLQLETLDFEPGLWEIRAQVDVKDDEPANNVAWALVELEPQRRALYVGPSSRPAGEPALFRALIAQGLKPLTLRPEAIAARDLLKEHNLVILDGLAAAELDADATTALIHFVTEGGGLLFVPRDQPDDLLAWNRHGLAEVLPLAGLPEPRIPPADQPDEPQPDDHDEKLSDPDPERAEEKEIDAPTLVMLIVIDASASMKEGARIVYALRGAIATLRKLHPEDRIGVIAYNDQPMEVVPVQKAAARDQIERAIMRIEPDGATDIESALRFAEQTLAREEAAVKTVILLSDGFSRPFNVKAVARSLLAAGISVTTVGVGSEFDVPLLTQIAKYSGGTGPIPARNARQLPAVMVDVAARLIDHEGLRKAPDDGSTDPLDDEIVRPETRLDPGADAKTSEAAAPTASEAARIDLVVDRQVSFLAEIPWDAAPAIRGLHRSQEKRGSSRSLRTEDGRSVLSYWRRGHGVVAMSTLALDGAWADQLSLWDAFSPFVSQLAKFLALDAEARPVALQVEARPNAALVQVFDGRSRAAVAGWSFSGPTGPIATEALGDGRYRLQLDDLQGSRFQQLLATDPLGQLSVPFGWTRPLPAEISTRGVDLLGLQTWAEALGAEIKMGWDQSFVPPPRERRQQRSRTFHFAWIFLAVLGLELALKRFTIARSSSWS